MRIVAITPVSAEGTIRSVEEGGAVFSGKLVVSVTGLAGYLHGRKSRTLYVTGLALDFCVKWTVLDARKAGIRANAIEDVVCATELTIPMLKPGRKCSERAP